MIILFIALFLFGGKNLPGLARGLGDAVREFTKAKDEKPLNPASLGKPE